MNYFGFFIIGFLVSIIAIPGAYADTQCKEYYLPNQYQYEIITPLDHSITNGKFLQLCAEPNYLWYKIYLDTLEAGSLTITVPKDQLDLKQFDYESCYPNDLKTNIDYDRTITVTQIAQTDTSRTLKFTWIDPITFIEYFGTHAILDGVDYSEPNWCIGLVDSFLENGENDRIIKNDNNWKMVNSSDVDIEKRNYVPDSYCPSQINLNYTISQGSVDKICRDVDNNMFTFFTSDIINISKLTVDISYDYYSNFHDYSPIEMLVYYPIIVSNGQEIPHLVTIKNKENFQTFQIILLPNTKTVEFVYPFLLGSNDSIKYISKTVDLDLEKKLCKSDFVSLMKFDKSKSVCVKPSSVEPLIQRGYGFIDT